VVGTHKDRLQRAEKLGAITIDNTRGGNVERLMQLNGGKGTDRGCETCTARRSRT